jgi:hypothetical protein
MFARIFTMMVLRGVGLFALLIITSYAGLAQDGSIEKNRTAQVGLNLKGGSRKNNAKFIEVYRVDSVRKYLPEELDSYRLSNGRVYKSRIIEVGGAQKRYFFEKLLNGKSQVFYLPGKLGTSNYYLSPGDSIPLRAMPERLHEFRAALATLVSDCPSAVSNVKYVTSRPGSTMRLLRQYSTCSSEHLPRVRWGVTLGLNFFKFNGKQMAGAAQNTNFSRKAGLDLSGQVVLPIGMGDMSFAPMVSLHWYSLNHNFSSQQDIYDLTVNQLRLSVPMLARYTFHKKKSVPYLELGPTYSLPLYDHSTYFRYGAFVNDIAINTDEIFPLPTRQVGATLGGGLIRQYDNTRSGVMSARINRMYALGSQSDSLITSEVILSMGIIF